MSFEFKKAKKSAAKLRLGLAGISGGGKTYTALAIAKGLGGKVALIDTENASASKYADEFDFDTLNLTDHSPASYVKAIKAAEAAGYDVIIIDSLTHAWEAAKDMASAAEARSKSKNGFAAWKDVTPEYKKVQAALVESRANVIGTYRVKDEYVLEEVNGKKVPKKVGMAIEAGKQQEYEFDIVLNMEDGGKAIVSKTRYKAINGKVFNQPGVELGKELAAWLSDGTQERAAHKASVDAELVDGLAKAIFSAVSKEELARVAMEIKELSLPPETAASLRETYKKKLEALP